ncbi:nucleoid-associated protein [Riemerella anatipestifer]|uniref:nucleoid-associated protein n=1 Tax=Riemerella anatipestifer TaxID=34085 RepID=UPI001AD71EB5|nr:nucleoid-associated protein [Riemerella anatipestifer]MBO4233880.1 nucleoid-associated protein [Riemerella anatipestifer]
MITNIISHYVGNKIRQEKLKLSEEELSTPEEILEELNNLFISSFVNENKTFKFHSETTLENNIIYETTDGFFNEKTDFKTFSKNIAKHLYEVAENPRIQGGNLFVMKFETEGSQSVGIFKMERKDPFLKINNEEFTKIKRDFGFNTKKIDKGAIIHNSERESGYIVSVVDNNKNGDIHYWFEDFLNVRQREDDYFHTQETLSVYKDYITKQLPKEFEVTKADQADFLNKSLNYFKEREQFDFEEFGQEVLQDENIVESFINFKTDYEQDTQMSISEAFPINPTAVKKQQRHFKSVIRLDKNFHIYIHGSRKFIEQGQDEKGNFYKLYFEQES